VVTAHFTETVMDEETRAKFLEHIKGMCECMYSKTGMLFLLVTLQDEGWITEEEYTKLCDAFNL
jgi:hypothetical protein